MVNFPRTAHSQSGCHLSRASDRTTKPPTSANERLEFGARENTRARVCGGGSFSPEKYYQGVCVSFSLK